MNPSSQYPHRRRLTRAEARRRRRNRAIRRVAGLTLVACVLVGGVSFLLHRKAPVPAASAASALPAASSTAASEAATNGLFGKNEAASSAVSSEPAAPDNALGLTAEEEETEKEHILEALRQTGNNKSKAAQLLNIDRKTLYNKLKLYNIDL